MKNLNFKIWWEEKGTDWLDEEGYTLFFKQKNNFYAGKEGDRIIFAKMKAKDTKDIPLDKIFFTAINLKDKKNKTFEKKDIEDLEVCEKEEALNSVSV